MKREKFPILVPAACIDCIATWNQSETANDEWNDSDTVAHSKQQLTGSHGGQHDMREK